MDPLVPDRSNAAGLLPWMPVVDAVRIVWRAARVGARPTAVCALYSRVGADRRAPRPTSTHVRRRLPGVPQHVRRRCPSDSQQVRSMYCGHQRLAECMQTSTKRGEDAAAVAWLESAVGQGRVP